MQEIPPKISLQNKNNPRRPKSERTAPDVCNKTIPYLRLPPIRRRNSTNPDKIPEGYRKTPPFSYRKITKMKPRPSLLLHDNSEVIQRLLATISKANHASKLIYIQIQRQLVTQFRRSNYLLRKSYQENHQSPLNPPRRKGSRFAVYVYHTMIRIK